MKPKDTNDAVAAARIWLQMVGRKRWKGVAKEDRRKLTSVAGKAGWAKLTPEERSAEMKRRAKVRARNRRRKG